MKKVFIASRLRGNTQRNEETAKELGREVLRMGHVPILPHLYFPQLLRDDDPEDRGLGIVAGLNLMMDCDEMVIYDDDGISDGMAIEIAYWKANKSIEPKRWHAFANSCFKQAN